MRYLALLCLLVVAACSPRPCRSTIVVLDVSCTRDAGSYFCKGLGLGSAGRTYFTYTTTDEVTIGETLAVDSRGNANCR